MARSLVGGWVAVGAMVVACGKDDSLGNDNGNPLLESGTGGAATATGGAKSQTGGADSKGGANGSGGSGGTASKAGTGGTADCGMIACFRAIECVESCGGPVRSSGCCPCPDGTFDQIQCSLGVGGEGGASGTTGGSGGASAGGSPPTTGGSTSTGGAAGEMGGSGSDDPGEPVADLDATGRGVCADRTLGEIIDAIHEANPDLADIRTLDDPSSPVIGLSEWIQAFRSSNGFQLVFVRGSGDCPAGCINREYWYFETDAACEPVSRGYYTGQYQSSANCYRVVGTPRWNVPAPPTTDICEVDLDDLNDSCVNDSCPAGLETDYFYGVAGTQGPLFCACTIPCENDPAICPAGTTCTTISDGPGEVCYQP